MEENLLVKIIKDFSDLRQKFNRFLWHGGESTLSGIDFFENAVYLQEKYFSRDQVIINSIQTNGTTINNKFINFFKKNNFRVGISIDGPKSVHDINRKYPNGSGTFSKVFKVIKNLRDEGMPIGVVCVITKSSIKHYKEILSFFMENNINRINFSPAAELIDSKTLAYYSLSPLEWGEFLSNLFDYWIKLDNPKVRIQIIDSLLKICFKGKTNFCMLSRRCNQFISIDYNGDLYICGRFFGNKDFCFSNIEKQTIKEALLSGKFLKLSKKTTSLPKHCYSCLWKDICNGGCAYYRFMNGPQENSPYFCQSMKIIIPHIKKTLTELGLQRSTIWCED